jgi:cytochrome c peroxidase
MHASATAVARQLNDRPAYAARFRRAYPTQEKKILPRHVLMALASYIRSLTPFNSRFDRYMRGDDTQLSTSQVRGFNLFMGKAKCGTCHFMPVFNGTAGPGFTTTEAEVLGVAADPGRQPLQLDPEPGRYFQSKIRELRHSFKTPTLRNIAKTAPYMHNGAYQTLAEVIDFYDQGGGAGLGLDVDNQTLASEPLHLSKEEKKAIIAFLRALSDN